jgi:hypothetical protein
MSLIGRKNRCETAGTTSDPGVSVPCIVQPPRNQVIAAASADDLDGG